MSKLIRMTFASILAAIWLSPESISAEMPGKHYVRSATVAVEDSEKLTSSIRDWIAFTKKHVPDSAPWDCYIDTNGRLHRVSYLNTYAALDEQQRQQEEAFVEYQKLGHPDMSLKWNKGAGVNSVNLWRFEPELSYVKRELSSKATSYRKVYYVHLKRNRVGDWIEAAKLMNVVDRDLGQEYHRYVYECELGNSQPLYAVVIPAENQQSYLEAFEKRTERRQRSSLNVKVQALFRDAARKIDEVHLTHHPKLSYKPERFLYLEAQTPVDTSGGEHETTCLPAVYKYSIRLGLPPSMTPLTALRCKPGEEKQFDFGVGMRGHGRE